MSTLHLVRALIALRRAHPALGARATTRVIADGYPLVYVRGAVYLVVVNPRRAPAVAELAEIVTAEPLLVHGATVNDGRVQVDGFGYGVFELPG